MGAYLAHIQRITDLRAWEEKEIVNRLMNARAPLCLLPLIATPYHLEPHPRPFPDTLPPNSPSAPSTTSLPVLPIPTPSSRLRGGAGSDEEDASSPPESPSATSSIMSLSTRPIAPLPRRPPPHPAARLRGGTAEPEPAPPSLLSRISDRPRRPQCWHCKKKGHLKKDCPKKRPSTATNQTSGWDQVQSWGQWKEKADYAARFCTGCNVNQRAFPNTHWANCPIDRDEGMSYDLFNNGPFEYEGNDADNYE